MLDVSANGIGFGGVDGLRNKVAVRVLAGRRVWAEPQHGGVRCQQRVGAA